jgi:hypothetical protein
MPGSESGVDLAVAAVLVLRGVADIIDAPDLQTILILGELTILRMA